MVALTSGHLDELGDTEHPRGDEAFLEVCRICMGERRECWEKDRTTPPAPHCLVVILEGTPTSPNPP